MKKFTDYDKIQKKNEQKNHTDYEEIWRIAKKFIPAVRFTMQLMGIKGITTKFISYFVIILFFHI